MLGLDSGGEGTEVRAVNRFSSVGWTRTPGFFQLRLRWLWITQADGRLTVWLCIGGRKPLAHLPVWRRRLFHLPSIRWRLYDTPAPAARAAEEGE